MFGGAFTDRRDAGLKLADALEKMADRDPVVLALPRGGVPIGVEVARRLKAPLDLVMVRKIGVPWQPELAYGAVVDGDEPETVINRDIAAQVSVPEDYLEKETARQLDEIARRRALYLKDRARPGIAGRTAIIVDDGIATGATVRAALIGVRRAGPQGLVLAVPVAPGDTVAALRGDADEIVCLETPLMFGAISQFYRDFHQVSDDEVIALLDGFAKESDPAARPDGSA